MLLVLVSCFKQHCPGLMFVSLQLQDNGLTETNSNEESYTITTIGNASEMKLRELPSFSLCRHMRETPPMTHKTPHLLVTSPETSQHQSCEKEISFAYKLHSL